MQTHKHPKELITHIKAQLTAHEAPYASGAWEKFNRKKKKKPVLWLSGVAAILVLGFTLFWAMHQNFQKTMQHYAVIKPAEKTFIAKKNKLMQKNGNNISKQTTLHVASKNNGLNNLKTTAYDDPTSTTSNKHQANTAIQLTAKINTQKTINATSKNKNNNLNNFKTIAYNNPTSTTVATNLPDTLIQLIANNTTEQLGNKIADTAVKSINNAKLEKIKNLAFFDKQAKVNEATKTSKKNSKWLIGIAIAPSFDNTSRLNMGYGVNMEYAISQKIAINSGISYNQLSTTRGIASANTFYEDASASIKSQTAASVKNLESVNAQVGGIDIPLEIKYSLSKSFYANVGISAFAILNQQRKNNYVEEKLVTQFTSTLNGDEQLNNFLVYERTSEKVADNEIENTKYLAFYNFSLGYKKRLIKNTFVSFEPFIKLPAKEMSTQKLLLIGTGLRLKFNF